MGSVRRKREKLTLDKQLKKRNKPEHPMIVQPLSSSLRKKGSRLVIGLMGRFFNEVGSFSWVGDGVRTSHLLRSSFILLNWYLWHRYLAHVK